MKPGISSWTYSWSVGIAGYPLPQNKMDIMSLLKKAVQKNIQTIQIADNLPLDEIERSEFEKAVSFARSNNLDIEPGTRGLCTENLINYIKIAKLFNSKLIRTLPHTAEHRPSFAEALSLLKQIEPYLRKTDIKLAVENHDFYTSHWLAELMDELKTPYIGVCLDAVNNFGQGESFNEVIKNLARHTINFHCKDYTIKRKDTMLGFDITGTPAGQGMLDLKKATGMLNPDISCIIELWTPWQGNIIDTVNLESKWADESVEYIKSFENI